MKNWCIYHPKDNEVIEYLRNLKHIGLKKWGCDYFGYYYLTSENILDYSAKQPTGYTLLTEQEFKEQIMNKKELPKYFVIKRNSSNPLWDKYIGWLNKTYNTKWVGNTVTYYGFDGSCNCWNTISLFYNNPTLLTLEEWDSIVNPKEEFILPEKWCIEITPENQQVLNNWRVNIKKYATFPCKPCKYPYLAEDGSGNSEIRGKEITFEQFKRHVLKQEMYTIEQIKEKKIVVKFNSIEEYKKLSKYFDKTENCTLSFVDFTKCSWYSHYSQYDKILRYNSNFWVNLSKYKKIEFNQVIFENMEQKEEIIGYKAPFSFTGSTDFVTKGDIFTKEKGEFFYTNNGIVKKKNPLPKEIVETWEPVYKTKEQKYTLSNGKEVTITKEHVMCAGENVKIEKFQELVNYYKNVLQLHSWIVTVKEVTFKIGCWEDVKLSDIQEIIKIHDNIS